MPKGELTKSILTSVKEALGIVEEYEHFDAELVMHINSVFSILTQLGAGPEKGFMIYDKSTTWDEYIPNEEDIQLVKSYMVLRVKLLFDSSSLSASVIEAMNQEMLMMEWRLTVMLDSRKKEGDTDDQRGDESDT